MEQDSQNGYDFVSCKGVKFAPHRSAVKGAVRSSTAAKTVLSRIGLSTTAFCALERLLQPESFASEVYMITNTTAHTR